jgi:hypothetical protein
MNLQFRWASWCGAFLPPWGARCRLAKTLTRGPQGLGVMAGSALF